MLRLRFFIISTSVYRYRNLVLFKIWISYRNHHRVFLTFVPLLLFLLILLIWRFLQLNRLRNNLGISLILYLQLNHRRMGYRLPLRKHGLLILSVFRNVHVILVLLPFLRVLVNVVQRGAWLAEGVYGVFVRRHEVMALLVLVWVQELLLLLIWKSLVYDDLIRVLSFHVAFHHHLLSFAELGFHFFDYECFLSRGYRGFVGIIVWRL